MRGKFATAVLSIISISLFTLTGCGNTFPDLSEEEYDQTVQYAAGLLMKYSNNAVEKLIYVNPDKVELEDEEEEEETTSKTSTKKEDTSEEKEEAKIPGTSASTDSSMDHNANFDSSEPIDNPTVDISIADASIDSTSDGGSSAESTSNSSSTTEETTASGSSTSSAEVMSYTDELEVQDGLFLRYNGYYVTSSYPENAKTMVIEAGSGKRLLVFSFRAVNESNQDIYLDMVSLNPYFRININGNDLGYASVTMLDNDLGTFTGTIAAGDSQTLVLVKEIDVSLAKSIDTVEVTLTMEGQSTMVIME